MVQRTGRAAVAVKSVAAAVAAYEAGVAGAGWAEQDAAGGDGPWRDVESDSCTVPTLVHSVALLYRLGGREEVEES